MKYQTPAPTFFKQKHMFLHRHRPTKKNLFPRNTTRQPLAGQNSGSVFKHVGQYGVLSVHPCEAHIQSPSLQASADTDDSESGSSDLFNVFRRQSNVVVLCSVRLARSKQLLSLGCRSCATIPTSIFWNEFKQKVRHDSTRQFLELIQKKVRHDTTRQFLEKNKNKCTDNFSKNNSKFWWTNFCRFRCSVEVGCNEENPGDTAWRDPVRPTHHNKEMQVRVHHVRLGDTAYVKTLKPVPTGRGDREQEFTPAPKFRKIHRLNFKHSKVKIKTWRGHIVQNMCSTFGKTYLQVG